MSAVLETKALNKHFGAVTAAKDISVSIESGEQVGIIGANGAGKTTFINLVTGYLKPSWGKIFYQGKNITSLPSRKITRLGISRSFQIPQLFSELSVGNNVLIALGLSSSSSSSFFKPLFNEGNFERVKQVLSRFDLQEDINILASTLPQGKRKLLDIAMATVNDPNLILLDEPTSGVSTEEKFAVMERLMKTLSTTTLLIEHDMEVVENFCTRIIAFYEGEVIANGSVKDVLTNEQVKEYIVGKELYRKNRQDKEMEDNDTLDEVTQNRVYFEENQDNSDVRNEKNEEASHNSQPNFEKSPLDGLKKEVEDANALDNPDKEASDSTQSKVPSADTKNNKNQDEDTQDNESEEV